MSRGEKNLCTDIIIRWQLYRFLTFRSVCAHVCKLALRERKHRHIVVEGIILTFINGGSERNSPRVRTCVSTLQPVARPCTCVDGTYKHDGRDCCLCAAGLYLVEHCTKTLEYGKCEACKVDTYSNNLEEDEPCTPARNRKCRCRKDHYCSSKLEICRLCNPCKVELYPHLPDIAAIIGWKDMKDIAIASGIREVTIETVQLDHQNDHEEQTQELLTALDRCTAKRPQRS
uniref:Uncharacterized protein n=1 Tax=Takifugu rubripes TaxID=31033 RepID=Q90XY4_TAKRU|nr:hypothetical protein [Takifugu rubripes]